jgi:hypothetical protein
VAVQIPTMGAETGSGGAESFSGDEDDVKTMAA